MIIVYENAFNGDLESLFYTDNGFCYAFNHIISLSDENVKGDLPNWKRNVDWYSMRKTIPELFDVSKELDKFNLKLKFNDEKDYWFETGDLISRLEVLKKTLKLLKHKEI